MKRENIQKLTLAAMFLAIGLVLPFVTGQIREIGKMLLPMHLPVLLCGLICGWQYGLVVGVVTPLLRSVSFGMPLMYPSAIAMAFELATYGFVTGFLYGKSRWKCICALYRAILAAILVGRVVWGLVTALLLGMGGKAFTIQAFLAGAFLEAIPGIVLQLMLVPMIMVALGRARLVPFAGMNKKDRRK
ncbi:MAG: ECF transporter S component [Faecalimonas sp.]|nr:ECF transporter S component [Faecalimonas sp.]